MRLELELPMVPSWYLQRIGVIPGGPNQVHQLRGRQTIVAGRSPSCPVHTPSRFTSRRQCEFQYVLPSEGCQPQWCVRDLGSANGTFLQGERINAHQWQPLQLGQEVGFGGPVPDEPELFVFVVVENDPRRLNNTYLTEDVIVVSDEDVNEPPPSRPYELVRSAPLVAARAASPAIEGAASSASPPAEGPSEADRGAAEVGQMAPKRGPAEYGSPPGKRRRSNSDEPRPTAGGVLSGRVATNGVAGIGASADDSSDDVIILEYVPPPVRGAVCREIGSIAPQPGRNGGPPAQIAAVEAMEASDALAPSSNGHLGWEGAATSGTPATGSTSAASSSSVSGSNAGPSPAVEPNKKSKTDCDTSGATSAVASVITGLASVVVPKRKPPTECDTLGATSAASGSNAGPLPAMKPNKKSKTDCDSPAVTSAASCGVNTSLASVVVPRRKPPTECDTPAATSAASGSNAGPLPAMKPNKKSKTDCDSPAVTSAAAFGAYTGLASVVVPKRKPPTECDTPAATSAACGANTGLPPLVVPKREPSTESDTSGATSTSNGTNADSPPVVELKREPLTERDTSGETPASNGANADSPPDLEMKREPLNEYDAPGSPIIACGSDTGSPPVIQPKQEPQTECDTPATASAACDHNTALAPAVERVNGPPASSPPVPGASSPPVPGPSSPPVPGPSSPPVPGPSSPPVPGPSSPPVPGASSPPVPGASSPPVPGASSPPAPGPSGEPPSVRPPSGVSDISDDERLFSSDDDEPSDRLPLPSLEQLALVSPLVEHTDYPAYSQEDAVIVILDDDEEYFAPSQADPELPDSGGEENEFDPHRRIKEEAIVDEYSDTLLQSDADDTADECADDWLEEFDAAEPDEPAAEELPAVRPPARPRLRSPPPPSSREEPAPEDPTVVRAAARPRLGRSPPSSPAEEPAAEEPADVRPPARPRHRSSSPPSPSEEPALEAAAPQARSAGPSKRAVTIGSRVVHITPPAGPRIAQTDALPLRGRGRRGRGRGVDRSLSLEERPPTRRRRRRVSEEASLAELPPQPPSPPPQQPQLSEQERRERRKKKLKTVAERNVTAQRLFDPDRPKTKPKVKVTGLSRGEHLVAELKKMPSFNRKSPSYRPGSVQAVPSSSAAAQTPSTPDDADNVVPRYVPGITQSRHAHPVPASLVAFNAAKSCSSGQAGPSAPAPGPSAPAPAAPAAPATAGPSTAAPFNPWVPAADDDVRTSPSAAGPSSWRRAATRAPRKSVSFAPDGQICRTQYIPPRVPRESRQRASPVRRIDLSLWRILSWRYVWLQEETSERGPPPVAHEMPVRPSTPLSYTSHDDLVQTFEPLLLHELWHKVAENWRQRKSQPKDNVVPVLAGLVNETGLEGEPDHWRRADESVFLRVTSLETQDLPSAGVPSGSRSLVIAHCEALVSRRTHCHPEPGALACLDLPQHCSGQSRSTSRAQVFAYVKEFNWMNLSAEELKKRLELQFPGARPDELAAYSGARYTLQLRQRDTLDSVDWTRLVKLKSVSYINSELRLFSSLHELHRSKLLPAVLNPSQCPAAYNLPPSLVLQPVSGMLSSLNHLQWSTVCRVSRAVLDHPQSPQISVVHGPPGTGKTEVIVSLVKQVLLTGGAGRRLLLCAPSNAAVDELTRRLVAGRRDFKTATEIDLKVVRFGRSAHISEAVRPYSLENLLKRNVDAMLHKMNPAHPSKAREELDLRKRLNTTQKKLAAADRAEAHRLNDVIKTLTDRLREVQQPPTVPPQQHARILAEERENLLKRANVITTTLASSFGHQLAAVFQQNRSDESPFTCCIVDEAGQCTEPEALIPLEYGIKKLVLVGDHNQLAPTVMSQSAGDRGLRCSLMERLNTLFVSSAGASPVVMLEQQYRMQADICLWPAARFYGGRLETCAPLPPPPLGRLRPYLLIQTQNGSCENNHPEGGFSNSHEAALVVRLTETVARLCAGGQHAPSVGIITPYQRQCRLIQNELNNSPAKSLSVDVRTVDGFQGQERDVVILSFVRSNFAGKLGFLTDMRRLNVALTRARSCLYACGDFGTLAKNDDWRFLIQDAQRRQMVIKETAGLQKNQLQLERLLLRAPGSSGSGAGQ